VDDNHTDTDCRRSSVPIRSSGVQDHTRWVVLSVCWCHGQRHRHDLRRHEQQGGTREEPSVVRYRAPPFCHAGFRIPFVFYVGLSPRGRTNKSRSDLG